MTLLLCVIYIAFISLGLPDSLLGAAWPVMYSDIGAGVSQAGLISMTVCMGTIVSALFSQRLIAKAGTKVVTAVSTLMTALALFGISRAPSLPVVLLCAIPLGLGAGSIDAALNNYVALHFKANHMSFLHCCWGIGTIVGPSLISTLITGGSSWRWAYVIVSCAQCTIALILFASFPLWNKAQKLEEESSTEEEKNEILPLTKVIRIRGVIFALLSFLLYCGFENSAMLWSASFMVFGKGFTAAEGAALASMVFLGMTTGRFINGLVAGIFSDKVLIRIGQAITLLAVILLLLPVRNLYLAYISLFLLGTGFGPIYPCMIHQTVYYYDRRYSQAIIGLQMASAYVGSSFMPPLYGLLSSRVGHQAFPYWVLILLILMIITITLKNRMSAERARSN